MTSYEHARLFVFSSGVSPLGREIDTALAVLMPRAIGLKKTPVFLLIEFNRFYRSAAVVKTLLSH